MLTVLENCRVSPPPTTVGERSLPLTFIDMIGIQLYPVQQVFFYEFPHSRQHFLETIVPTLKHSLSITLQQFFPFAGNLIVFLNPSVEKKPEIRHVEGDSVAVTVAECTLDFNHLTGNHPRKCDMFYPLVPLLGRAAKVSDYLTIPVFSVQVTLFPNSGISIGITNHHSLCDVITRFDFLKAWSSIAMHGTDELFLASGSLPFYERVLKYPSFLDEIALNIPGIPAINADYQPPELVSPTDNVRATIILTQAHVTQLKKRLSTQLPAPEYISPFSVACSYMWHCLAKSHVHIGERMGDDDVERFVCAVGWRSRLDPPLPETYFGNCIGVSITPTIKSTVLAGNNGFFMAAELFRKTLSETVKKKNGTIEDGETAIKTAFTPVPEINVSGSPKIKFYDVDFGWGKPKKHETISIDNHNMISVNASKESPADIEIGVSLPGKQMDAFISILSEELEGTFY
ncbi:hypothetical protein L2E82_23224 [Cichorium intybus]|uniref:Uncharacterized protein n=1 Tax=Cichorium intybus TaxID=13427 RepID=A0ACB9DZT4_CICIN|nr:hypothetical protein L2E82_23224 [Cichorium intybus]